MRVIEGGWWLWWLQLHLSCKSPSSSQLRMHISLRCLSSISPYFARHQETSRQLNLPVNGKDKWRGWWLFAVGVTPDVGFFWVGLPHHTRLVMPIEGRIYEGIGSWIVLFSHSHCCEQCWGWLHIWESLKMALRLLPKLSAVRWQWKEWHCAYRVWEQWKVNILLLVNKWLI